MKKFSRSFNLLNTASNLIIEILGNEDGSHSRSVAIGVNSLPKNSSVEIDGIFSIL